MSITVVNKANGVMEEAPLGSVQLSAPSLVKINNIAPEDVIRFERAGNDLVLVLANGQNVVIASFFETGVDGDRSELILEDADGTLWWAEYSTPWSEFQFTEIQAVDDVAGLAGASAA